MVHDDPQPRRPHTLAVTQLQIGDAQAGRFWEIGRDGRTVHTRWGRLGQGARNHVRVFDDEPSAEAFLVARIAEKRADGYEEIAVREG